MGGQLVKATLGLSAAALLFTTANVTAEQAALRAALEQCELAVSAELRIACLERALQEAYGAAGPSDSPAATDASPLQLETRPGDERAGPAESSAAAPEEHAAQAEGSDTGSAPERIEPVSRSAESLGSEQVTARERSRRAAEEPARMVAKVRHFDVVPYQRLQVELDNGQIWRQIQGDTQRITIRRNRDVTADVWESNMGGYQMRLNEIGRTIRVERLK